MKYIIKNCPNCNGADDFQCECGFNGYTQFSNPCKDSDCLLKQIVEKCKNYKRDCKIEGNCLDNRLCSTCFLGGANELGEWILSDLEIEEKDV